MTSNQSHKAVVFGSISIDKIVNKHGSFPDILGGSAAYALLANKKNSCESLLSWHNKLYQNIHIKRSKLLYFQMTGFFERIKTIE